MAFEKQVALTDDAIEQIEKNLYNGYYNDHELARLIETTRIQKTVVLALLNLFHKDDNGVHAVPDSIRASTLALYKRMCALEDR